MDLDDVVDIKEIKSPMFGTFHDSEDFYEYKKKHPQENIAKAPPYVEIGSHVIPEVVIYDIEAMKVRVPIEAGVYGTIIEKLVNNGDFVEYNQVLFKIATNE